MEADTSQPQSSSPSKKERDATVEAVNHLIQGKRHLLVQDYSSAVTSLEEACRLLAACYGDLANECGDAYYHYGRALLELSRKESGIFGNSKDGDESGGEDDDDEEEEDDDDNDNEAENKDDEEESEEESKSSEGGAASGLTAKCSEAGGTLKEPGEVNGACVAKENSELVCSEDSSMQKEQGRKEDSEAKSEDLDESKKADEETHAPEPNAVEKPSEAEKKDVEDSEPKVDSSSVVDVSGDADKPSSSAIDDPQPGPSGEQKPKEEDSEEITNLQLAWEVLELAKVIFKRQADNRELRLRLAQVHSKLGEVAMESENYPQSIEDLEECLALQLPLLEKDARELAETYYQLGLAYTFAQSFDSAINGFQLAINTINSRIENLTKIVATNAPPTEQGEDPVFHAKLELEELQELLPELREKIADIVDLRKNTVKAADEISKDFAPAKEEQTIDSTVSPVKEAKPISNIGHLVRKKRKPEENSPTSASCNEIVSKRNKTDISSEMNNSVHVTSTNSESHVNGKSLEADLTLASADTSSA